MIYSLIPLADTALLALFAWLTGHLLLRKQFVFECSIVTACAEISIGLLTLSYLLFALIETQRLTPSCTQIASLCITLLGGATGIGLILTKWRITISRIRLSPAATGGLLAVGLIYVAAVMLMASLPPTERDELIYHLEVPKQWIAHHGAAVSLDNIYAYFPQLGETLFLLPLSKGGEAGAKLIHALYGFITAASLYGYSRKHLPRFYSFLAALLFLSIPSVFLAMGWAHVDLIFTAYTFLALLALIQFLETCSMKWACLMGVLTGACFATKYTGLSLAILFSGILLLAGLFRMKSSKPADFRVFGSHIKAVLILCLATFVMGFPYLYRNEQITGWPLFPFEIPFFSLKPNLNWDTERARLYLTYLGSFGTHGFQQTFLDIAKAPVAVFLNGAFNSPERYEGVLSPIFLLIPPLLLLTRPRFSRDIVIHITFALFFLYYWTCTTRQIRFILPVLPSLCFLLLWLCYAKKSLRVVLALLTGVAVCWNINIGVREELKKQPLAFWRGRESREAFIERQWNGLALYAKANELLTDQDTVYLAHMKNYVYYLDHPWRSDFIFERYWLENLLRERESEADLLRFIMNRGLTHIMMDERFIYSNDWGLDPDLALRLRKLLTRHATLIVRQGQFVLYRFNI